MHYSIRHLTRFRYDAPIAESVMELRMQPRNDDRQHCVNFELSIRPRTNLTNYRDHLGNVVHHFDIPGQHANRTIKAESRVQVTAQASPESSVVTGWGELDKMVERSDYWEMLMPSRFAAPTELLSSLIRELDLRRRDDPFSLLRELTTSLHDVFEYAPQSTEVDSPIDKALKDRRGVCQDLAHIMIAMVRSIGIPCRYVSGYLFHRAEDHDRSAADATHAWVEARLPEIGWIGFDPTNDLITGERHIRVAIGRDYSDVPPTRGVFKGEANSELSVAVQVATADEPLPDDKPIASSWLAAERPESEMADHDQQQQQQQQ